MNNPEAGAALEVCVRWGADVLATRRFQGRAEARVGVVAGSLAPIPLVELSAEGFVLARVAGGRVEAFVPEGLAGERRTAAGAVEAVAGPAEVALRLGDRLTLRTGDFELSAAAVDRGAPRLRGPASIRTMVAVSLAAVLHGAVLVQSARAAAESPEETASAAVQFLAEAEQRLAARAAASSDGLGEGEGARVDGHAGDGRAGGGTRAEHEEGALGSSLARPGIPGRWALPAREARPRENQPPKQAPKGVAAQSSLGLAELVGTLGRPSPGLSTFASAVADQEDALAARGSLWARALGEAEGAGGLGLSGVGEGGGGDGQGVGLGTRGALGHAAGLPGNGTGGEGAPRAAHLAGWHRSWRAYRCGYDSCSVTGRLPAEAIQRIVRQHAGVLRGCYERGLFKNPTLAGRVSTKFLIDRSGAVASASNAGSDLPAAEVVACIVRAFYGMSFPEPEGGIVTVIYPVTFTPE